MTNNDSQYVVSTKSFTSVAINTAAKAGEWIKSRSGQISQLQYKSSPRDLVTEVDKGAETMIRNLIQTHFPDHKILGEEGTQGHAEEAEDSDYLWIVDPIDGTTNFIHGFPYYSVSIALAYRGELIVGVVHDPFHDELFVAEKGKGAYLKGKRLSVSAEKKLADSLLASGFSAHEEIVRQNLAGVSAIVGKARNIRISGSAALHLAYVAAGRLSGYWQLGLKPWDYAAGALLVQEAGGKVTDAKGREFHLSASSILATNGSIHDELHRELEKAGGTG
jgi:myo-inositol-1(or 4)-monophosphatase